jgi:response regulator RpfG family c-di-GMP phosphodiesterase
MSEENKGAKTTVLFVDDEEHNLISFKATFRRDFKVFTANSAEEARELLAIHDIHVLITDQRMPEETGVELLASILDKHPEPMRILLTGYADIEAVIDSINIGRIYKYIPKPWDTTNLTQTIKDADEIFRLRRENKELMAQLKKANEQLEFLLRQKLLD